MLNHKSTRSARLFWLGALLGAAVFLLVYGLAPLDVANDAFCRGGYIEKDIQQHYAGWLFYRSSALGWPLGVTQAVNAPQGVSVAYTDSIPLLAVLCRPLAAALGGTFQYFGWFTLVCFALQGGFAALLAAFAVWAVLSKKLALHRLIFVLVLGLGLLYSFVLPPYAAPDEKYHINQSFTLASRWANDLSREEWRMGRVPTTTTFRRVGDEDADLQNENTTVFTWEAFTSQLLTTTEEPFDSHQEYNELQTDQNPLLYLASAAAVFLAYLLHLGFAPALLLGRLANLLLFAALAALAVRAAPFGKRVFTAAALLPMTLHLAASFSRDAPLLGCSFAFTALLLDAAFGPDRGKALSPARLAALLLCGVVLAPGKLVYLPLAALLLLVPAARLGRHAKAKKCGRSIMRGGSAPFRHHSFASPSFDGFAYFSGTVPEFLIIVP